VRGEGGIPKFSELEKEKRSRAQKDIRRRLSKKNGNKRRFLRKYEGGNHMQGFRKSAKNRLIGSRKEQNSSGGKGRGCGLIATTGCQKA